MNNETVVQNQSDQEPRISEPLVHQDLNGGKTKLTFDEKMRKFLIKRPKTVLFGWVIVALAFLLVLPVSYFCWYILTPLLWEWSNAQWYHWIPAFFAFIALISIPFYNHRVSAEL